MLPSPPRTSSSEIPAEDVAGADPEIFMTETVGKQLCQARPKRGLSIEEAAHATKLRPDKIIALENDDYSRFASNSYARGFLQIYGRFLKVDVSGVAHGIDSSNPIAIDDYQYLNNAPKPKADSFQYTQRERKAQKIPVLPIVAVAATCVAAYFAFEVYVNWHRITGEQAPLLQTPKPRPAMATPAPVALALALATPAPEAAPALRLGPGSEGPAVPAPLLVPAAPDPAISDREFLTTVPAVPAATPVPSPDRDVVTPRSVAMHEIQIGAEKKTWVTVRRDDPNSPPVFEDYIYPAARPLKLRGVRFFIQAREPGAVQILKNGAPIAYQAPGVTIQ